MGSVLKITKKCVGVSSRSYSLAKQKCWHSVANGQNPPAPRKLCYGERVIVSKYCHFEESALFIK